SSTTRAAGGLHWSTTPKSMAPPSDEVLRQAAAHETAVAGTPQVGAVPDDHRAAGQHGVDLARDLETLPGAVVHVHVVRLADADARVPRRVVDHHVRVGA